MVCISSRIATIDGNDLDSSGLVSHVITLGNIKENLKAINDWIMRRILR